MSASTSPGRRATRASSRRPRATTAPPSPARRRATASSASSSRRRSTAATSGSPRSWRRGALRGLRRRGGADRPSGPELFSHLLELLDVTGLLHRLAVRRFGVSGIETLGIEMAREMAGPDGRASTHVVITHAGGGNTTGTARGPEGAGATDTQIIIGLGRPPRPAHGQRHRLQPQELHHRPHRFRRAFPHLAGPRRRAA